MKNNTPSKIKNHQSLRVLMVEDSEDDVLLVIRELKKGGYSPLYERVETAATMKKALNEKQWDIILCDYRMPQFNAPSAIAISKEANIDIPIIIVSGTIGEDVGIECMRLGAHDYIIKGNLSRLCPAIARELEESEVRDKQRQAESQREAALEELRESEESFRAVTENAYDGIIIAENMGTHLFANKRASEITGYSVEELLKMRMKELAYPDEIPKLSEILKKRMSGEEVPRQYETAIVHKEGTKVQIEVTAATTFWHGQAAVIAIFRDISKRKQAEAQREAALKELRESEDRYRSIHDNSPISIELYDAEGTLINVNRSCQDLFGVVDVKDLQGLSLFANPNLSDEHKEKLRCGENIHYQSIYDFEKIKTAKLYRTSRAGIIWLDVCITPLKDSVEMITGFLIQIQDITERKFVEKEKEQLFFLVEKERDRSEKRAAELDAILSSMTDGLLLYDPDGRVVLTNEAAERIFDCTAVQRALPLEQRAALFISTREDGQHITDIEDMPVTRALRGETVRDFVVSIQHQRTGQLIWLSLSAAPVRESNGRFIGAVLTFRDITERKRAEDMLRISERRYRMAEAIGHVGNWEYNLQTTKFWGSDEAKRIYGFDPEALDFSTDEVEKCIPERKRVHQALVDLIEADKPYNLEFEIHPKNSMKPLTISSVAELKRGEHGNPLLVTGVIQDITERKRAEDLLRQSEEKYRTILENMQEGYFEVDLAGNFTFFNDSLCRILGYSKEELMGMNNRQYTDKKNSKKLFQTFNKVYNSGESTEGFDWQIIRKDGTKKYVEASVSMQKDSSDKPTGFSGIVRDVTDRKWAEEALRENEQRLTSIYNTVGDVIFHLAVEPAGQLRFVSVNQAFLNLTGLSPEIVVGRTVNEIIPEPSLTMVLGKYRQAIAENTIVRWEEISDYPAGRLTGVVSIAPVFDDKGTCTHLVGSVHDITDRKQAEERIHASLREKEILLREIHHRVKNNMQVISGLLDLPAALSGNPERRKMFRESQSRIHAMSLVHEKLYGSKDFTRIDLTDYVRTMSQDLFQTYKIYPGEIDLIIQTDGDVYVDINKAIPCGLILNELISNALKHAFSGDIHGEIQILIRGMKNTEIEIVVRDNGLGLPDDVDIHQPRSVGLHLVNGLVKNQLDGKLEVRQDVGTEILIKFPL